VLQGHFVSTLSDCRHLSLAARVVQTLTTDLNIGLHANQPYADSQRRSKQV
jgi:hypothetical protein